MGQKDYSDYDQALRLYKDRYDQAVRTKQQAEKEIAISGQRIAMLTEMKNVIDPYLKKALDGSKITDFHIEMGRNYFDVTLYAQVTEMHTRIIEAARDLSKDDSHLMIAQAYTYVPQVQEKPQIGLHSRLEDLPEADNFISRLAEICAMPEEDRIIADSPVTD